MDSISSPFGAVTITSFFILTSFIYHSLYRKRFIHNDNIPRHPTSLLWGHLRLLDDYTKRGNPERHPDAVLSDMHKALGCPPLMALDIWPIRNRMVVIADHGIAEQLTKPSKEFHHGAVKAPTGDRLIPLVGPRSILCLHDEEWKEVRQRFNPGFAHSHLVKLLPCILGKLKPFLGRLDYMVLTGESFPFQGFMRDLTFDIMGAVLMDHDLDAQHMDVSQQGSLIRLYKELLGSFGNDRLHLPWWLMPLTELKRYRIGAQITEQLTELIKQKHKEMQLNLDQPQDKARTVLALGLQDTKELTPKLIAETCDQLKTFLFAGHDTSSTVISWALYELSRTPHALQAVQAELDRLFGSEDSDDPDAISNKLLAPGGEELVYRMPYISAVVKEVLRLYPPAGTLRIAQPGKDNWVTTPDGESYCLNDYWIYINHTIIHRNRAVYGDTADDFIPERWLSNESGGNASIKYPASAWRAYERGPRNCIGQELANIEARIIIAVLARRYNFVKVGLGEVECDENGQPILNEKAQYKVKLEMYNVIEITAKPAGEMVMRVVAPFKFRSK